MKKFITTLTIVLFVAISVFGITFMNYTMMNHTDCVASTMTGNPCPTNEIQLFMHHISSIQVFSIAVISHTFTLLAALYLLSVFICFILNKFLYHPPFLLRHHNYRKRVIDSYINKFLSWLSLFEHSPSI